MKILYIIILALTTTNFYGQEKVNKKESEQIERIIKNAHGNIQAGRTLPYFGGLDTEGKYYSNKNSTGVAVYNFWFTNCPPCIDEIPLLMKLKDKYKDKADFTGITFNDSETVKKAVKKYKFNYRHLIMKPQDIQAVKLSQGYPVTMIVRDNKVVYCNYSGLIIRGLPEDVAEEAALKVLSEIIDENLE